MSNLGTCESAVYSAAGGTKYNASVAQGALDAVKNQYTPPSKPPTPRPVRSRHPARSSPPTASPACQPPSGSATTTSTTTSGTFSRAPPTERTILASLSARYAAILSRQVWASPSDAASRPQPQARRSPPATGAATARPAVMTSQEPLAYLESSRNLNKPQKTKGASILGMSPSTPRRTEKAMSTMPG
jgi:hypothetical protein